MQADCVITENRLEECTIVPYRGSLKEYMDSGGEIQTAIVELLNEKDHTRRRIKVEFCDAENRIYIAEKEFNRTWKVIAQCLLKVKTMRAYRIGNPVPSVASVEEQVDLSFYETESRKAVLERGQVKLVGKPVSEEQQQLMMKRSSAMDNKKIVYAYSATDDKVHDKACPLVKQISNRDFRASETLPEGRWLCLNCRMMMVVRRGCGDDFKHYDMYKRFFQKGGVRVEAVEELVDGYHARIRMEDPDTLWVKCKEDQWKVVLNGERKVTLLHNNYMMVGEDQRYIFGGFHNQTSSGSVNMAYALKLIEGYTWEGHLAAKTEYRDEADEAWTGDADGRTGSRLEQVDMENAGDVGNSARMLWRRLRAWVRAVFKH